MAQDTAPTIKLKPWNGLQTWPGEPLPELAFVPVGVSEPTERDIAARVIEDGNRSTIDRPLKAGQTYVLWAIVPAEDV